MTRHKCNHPLTVRQRAVLEPEYDIERCRHCGYARLWRGREVSEDWHDPAMAPFQPWGEPQRQRDLGRLIALTVVLAAYLPAAVAEERARNICQAFVGISSGQEARAIVATLLSRVLSGKDLQAATEACCPKEWFPQ